MSDYWRESVQMALEDAGVKVTPEQERLIIDAITTSREHESLANAPTPSAADIESWKIRELNQTIKDRDKQAERSQEQWRSREDELISTIRRLKYRIEDLERDSRLQ